MRFFLGFTSGSYVLFPTVLLHVGRCPCHPDRIGALALNFCFLNLEAGIHVELYPHDLEP